MCIFIFFALCFGCLKDIGFLPKSFRVHRGAGSKRGSQGQDSTNFGGANINSKNLQLVKALLCAGLYPNIIVAPKSLVTGSNGNKTVGECAFQSQKGDVHVHPCTISFKEKNLDSRYCCYHEIVKTSKIYVRDCTTVSEFALLLFGGNLKVYHTHGVVALDKWLKFRIAAKPATLVKHLRAQMENMLLKKIVSPEDDVTGSPEGKALIQAVSALLEKEVREVPDRSAADIVKPWIGQNGDQGNRRGNGRGDQNSSRSSHVGGRGASAEITKPWAGQYVDQSNHQGDGRREHNSSRGSHAEGRGGRSGRGNSNGRGRQGGRGRGRR